MYKYFQKLPITFYSLDNYASTQVIPNYFVRTKFLPNVVNNVALFDEYQIKDGETPEITSMEFYGDTGLYWIILQANDILDPRFGWPLDQFNLKKFAEGKYTNINATHHYVANVTTGNVVNATLILDGSFANFPNANVITNNTNNGTAFISSKTNSSSVTVVTTSGGFISGDEVLLATNTDVSTTITGISITSGIPVTNLIFEDEENERRRSIKILKRQLVSEVIAEFEQTVDL